MGGLLFFFGFCLMTFTRRRKGKVRTVGYKLAASSERNNYQAQYKAYAPIQRPFIFFFICSKKKKSPQTKCWVKAGAACVRESTERANWRKNKKVKRDKTTQIERGKKCGSDWKVIKNRDKVEWEQWGSGAARRREEEQHWFTNSGVLSQVHALRQAGCLLASDSMARMCVCVCTNTPESLPYTHTHSTINTHTHIELGKSEWFKGALSCNLSFYWAVKNTAMW